jgi:DNA repair protein RecN (Recombination protein N)
MISKLNIKNYALIENLEIGFQSGFITITGETGAGKSILMGALSLILGKRADTSVLLKKDAKCIIEGQFRLNGHYKTYFEENDLDYDEESIFRREILPGGKSRAFINDTPVTLSVLKELGDQLVDIHSQHQSLQLSDHIYQLQVVDYVSNNTSLLSKYQQKYDIYLSKKSTLKEQQEEIDRISGEFEFYQYQFNELTNAELNGNEIGELEEEIKQLENAEEIKLALSNSSQTISGEGNILQLLNEALIIQKKNSSLIKSSEDYASRLESTYIELKDVAEEMSLLAERIEDDPGKLLKAKERMDLIYSLFQKHRVREIEELIVIRENLNKKITAITFSDEHLKKLETELKQVWEELYQLANKLHNARSSKGSFIEKQIAAQLVQLGIPNASFVVKVNKTDQAGRNGMDDVRFLFSANKQSPVEEISKVASGGEISRLMLSIKSLLSDYKGLPTLIFDEIDAGVSGEIAERMGAIMKKMSGDRQVIAITHLPQVASQGKEHFLVYKEDDAKSTITHIRKLNQEERIIEIAKLLSGEKMTDAAISNAKALLQVS